MSPPSVRGRLIAAGALTAIGAAALAAGGGDRATSPRPLADPTLHLPAERRPAIVSVRAGVVQTRPFPRFAPGDPPFRLVATGGLLVGYGADRRGPAAFRIDPRGVAQPRRLGEAWYLVPSARAGRVWLALLDPRSPDTVRALRGVREVDLRGRVTRREGPRPPRGALVGATARGLVIAGRALVVWHPGSGRILDRLPGPFAVAASADVVASCGGACARLHLSGPGRRRRALPPPHGFRWQAGRGAFSPDGRLLAVPARRHGGRGSVVALVAVGSGRAAAVRALPLPGPSWSLTWAPGPPGVRRLVTAAPGGPARMLVLPAGRIRTLVARLPGDVGAVTALAATPDSSRPPVFTKP